jgi:N-acetylmuramoyl-L-alanine amidase
VGIGGIYEKDIVLDISLQVASLLEAQEIQAILTRQTDVDLGLQPRVAIANRARAALFVSIHANAISMDRNIPCCWKCGGRAVGGGHSAATTDQY